ncbi:MAG: ATP-binding protein [Methanobrevibacter thaueri]|jgi:anti-sigma regulatory factor (Ser/Thr protein kinase)|uniref:ATP-binding protein n=1 Tax=Methanobrevibacter thaueri TaxID=190975 RepID=UPI0026EE0F46|nr:ATP-binding protein [Methanobrevibacter thaueri]MBE6495363.1 ATP-binding protein [Methanobrevibacter thaueri]
MNSLELAPQIEELYKLNDFINEIIGKQDFQVDLILEEVFVNIVNYSKTDSIRVNSSFENSILTLEFIDDGVEFNPLLNEDPKMPESIEDAEVGGLGIHLTKELSDDIEYDRIADENHLKITKKVE